MRGFPPLHLLFFVVLFGLTAWPLSQLTFARRIYQPQQTTSAQTVEPSSTTSARLTLRVSHPVSQLVIRPLHPQDAKPLAVIDSGNLPSFPTEIPVELALDENTIEISLEASWPSNTPDAAVTLELEPDGLDHKSQTVWSSDQQLHEILTFQWQP